MKNIKLLLFVVAMTILGTVHADPIKSFCAEVGQEHAQKKSVKGAGKFLWKFLFSPSSLVEIQKYSPSLQTQEGDKSKRVKLAFLSLPYIEITKLQKEELKEINRSRKVAVKELKKKSFYKEISKISTAEDCLSYIKREELTDTLIQLSSLAPRYIELKQIETDALTFKEQSKKKSFLKNEGWTILENKNLNEMYSLISEIKPTDVLLIGHASNDGKIYDSFRNPLPKSYFAALNIHNLIIYSCYSEESKNYYRFGHFNLYTASPTNFSAQFLNDSIPLNSLKVIKKIKLENVIKDKVESCSLELPIKTKSHILGLTLNKVFIGAANSRVEFPCSLLEVRNSLEIFSTLQERQIGTIGFSTVYFNNSPIHLDEFITTKNNRHIVSRGTF